MSIWKNKVLRKRLTIFFTTMALVVSPIGDLIEIGNNLFDASDPVSRFNATTKANNIQNQYNFYGSQQVEITSHSIIFKEKQLPQVQKDNTAVKSSGVNAPQNEPAVSKKRQTVVDTLVKMNEEIIFLLNKLRLATSGVVIAEVMEELYVFATMDGKYCHVVDSICQYLDEHPTLQLDVSKMNDELGQIVTMSKARDWANRMAYVQMIKKRVESRKIDG